MSRIEVSDDDVKDALRMLGLLEAFERGEVSHLEARAIAECRVRDLRGLGAERGFRGRGWYLGRSRWNRRLNGG